MLGRMQLETGKNSKGAVFCPDCKYFTYNQQEMNYHMAKKHAQSSSKQSTVCPSCGHDLFQFQNSYVNFKILKKLSMK